MYFLDINIIREQGKLITSVYRKLTFSGVYAHFYSFLPSTYKVGRIHTLLYRCFRICSDWTKFQLKLVKLMNIFKNNGYPENFINNFSKTLLDNKNRMQGKMTTVPESGHYKLKPS